MLDLKEVIWEITNRCNNNCSYCGSADVTGRLCETSEKDMLVIARQIAAYPPAELDISGGDPTLVSIGTHEKILKILRDANVVPKVLLNPLSIALNTWLKVEQVINQYDAVGVSLNVEDEYTIFTEHQKKFDMSKVTFVTNFNKSNLWMFDRLLDLAIKHNRPWQIQFTMYTESNSDAIYESELAILDFYNKIADARTKHAKIAIGDNINRGTCTAGLHTLGILSNGDVVPCVSMRAWVSNIEEKTQGNLLEKDSSLKDIWETQFKDERFSNAKCCARHCKGVAWRKDVNDILAQKPQKIDLPELADIEFPTPNPGIIPGSMEDIVLMYGIQMDRFPLNPSRGTGEVMVYAVVQDPPPIDFTDFDYRDNPVWKHTAEQQRKKDKGDEQ